MTHTERRCSLVCFALLLRICVPRSTPESKFARQHTGLDVYDIGEPVLDSLVKDLKELKNETTKKKMENMKYRNADTLRRNKPIQMNTFAPETHGTILYNTSNNYPLTWNITKHENIFGVDWDPNPPRKSKLLENISQSMHIHDGWYYCFNYLYYQL